jgi:dipicolinate synthase subunit B
MKKIKIAFALCGSFCTFSHAITQMEELKELGHKILPIMSETAYSTDTRFGKSCEINKKIEKICGKKIISSRTEAEPIGPKNMADLMLIAPCTGNTLAKLANGITDSTVTLAAKSHLRKGRPLLIALATNDALGASAKNIGKLLNTKNIYFIPLSQDDHKNKPNSLVAHFNMALPSLELAFKKEQIQPIFC